MHNRRFKEKNVLPYLFLLPITLFLLIFLFFPVLQVFAFSLQHYYLAKPQLNGFAGLGNYIEIFTQDATFKTAVGVSIKWLLVTVSAQLALGLSAALILNTRFWGRSFFRILFFLPWAISGILTSLLFSMIYNEHMGLLNHVLLDLGFVDVGIAWTANPNVVFSSVAVAEVWRGFPFFVIILLAALQSVDTALYDAADVDGAGMVRRFLHVTLPHIKETILFSTILRIIWEFNNVDVIYNITGGGPANMTTTLSMYIVRQASKLGNLGYGSALAVIAFVFLSLFIILYLAVGDTKEEDG